MSAIAGVGERDLRRRLIRARGVVAMVLDGEARRRSGDFGTLHTLEIPGDEPLNVVQVLNSTPEPDGSYRDYYLRVPPGIETAREAVAWTFGIDDPRTYTPVRQT